MQKQDRTAARTPEDIERRYPLGKILRIEAELSRTGSMIEKLMVGGEEMSASIQVNKESIAAEVKRATEAEGLLSSRITQTAERIELIVENSSEANGVLSSRITQNANSITAEVTRAKGAEGDLSSRITQTAESITAEVTRAKSAEGDLSSRITQNAESITSEVTRAKGAEGELSSRITQTADSITSEIARAKGAEGELSTSITQTSQRIAVEVTRATSAESELNTLILAEAGRVALLVDDSGKVKGSVIVQAINGQSAAKIKADLIEMTGTTTFLTPDDVGANGKTVIHGGRIDTNSLYIAADHIGGKLVVGDIFAATMPADGGAASVQIGGFTVTKSGLVHDRITIGTSGIGLGSPVSDMEGENVYHTTWISPLGKLISYQPIFYEMTVKGTTRFTGSEGQVVQFAIPIRASSLVVDGVDFADLVMRVNALDGGGHTHKYTLDALTVTATCTGSGTGVYRCSCGESKTEYVGALGHEYGYPYPDTGHSSGWAQMCTRCGDVIESECPHDSTTLTVTKEATCDAAGEKRNVCDNCGDSWFNSYIDPLGHDWEYYPDSSVSSGWSRVCKSCGLVEEDTHSG